MERWGVGSHRRSGTRFMSDRMKPLFSSRWSAALITILAVFVLDFPSTLQAQSSNSRRRRHPSAEITPTPTPESATPIPAPKPSTKPSSEQEVPPSRHPSGDHAAPGAAAVSSIEPSEIEGFDAYSEPVRQLLTAALDLTKKNLTYTYGSDNPANGGMDCSGTVSYLLKTHGFTDVPRQASEQYSWVRQKSRVYPVLSRKQDNAELKELRPGDLMFWTGTYNVDRDPPVTHAMIYLGRRKKDGHRLMFGASDGRPYDGQRRNGVSVFDFRMPAAREGDAADAATAAVPDRAPDFAGYGPIPGIADLNDAASRQSVAAHETVASTRERAAEEDSQPAKAKASPTPRRPRRSSQR